MAAQMCQLRLADRAWLCVGRETESNLAILAPEDIGFEKPELCWKLGDGVKKAA